MEDYVDRKARKIVKEKKGFYTHLGVYIAVGAFFLIMNLVTYSEEPNIWFFFPLLPWGVGLLIHYFSVFGLFGHFGKSWEEEELEKEKEKIYESLKRQMLESPERFDLDSQEMLDLREMRELEKKWKDDDLV